MRLLRILVLLLAGGLAASAQTNSAPAQVRELSLQECIELALKNNIELQIERYNPEISLYALQGIYGAYDPTLALSGQHDHNESGTTLLSGSIEIPGSVSDSDSFSGSLGGLLPWGTTYGLTGNANDSYGRNFVFQTNSIVGQTFESSQASTAINVSQPLLRNFLFDSTRLNIAVAKNRVKYSEQTLRLQIMQIITTLEQDYYDLIYSRENVLVQQKALELANQLVAENRKRVEVGALAPLDEKQAEAQAATTESALITAKALLAVQENLVKQLITDKFSDWESTGLAPSASLTAPRQLFNLQDSWSKGLTQRPDLIQAKLDVERAGIEIKYAKNQLLPELDVFGRYGYNGSGREFSGALYDLSTTDRPFWRYGGQLSIPLGNTAAKNAYRSAKVTREQALLGVKRIERNIMANIDDDIKRASAAYEAAGSTRAAREYAEAALQAEQKKLESGKSTTYTVLQMQRDLTNARGNEIQALAAYNRNLAALSLDEGSTLERHGINLQVK